MLPDKDQSGRPRRRQKESGAPITASPQAGLYAFYRGRGVCVHFEAVSWKESFSQLREIRYAAYRRERITPNSDPTVLTIP